MAWLSWQGGIGALSREMFAVLITDDPFAKSCQVRIAKYASPESVLKGKVIH